jgi:hypothetical protein
MKKITFYDMVLIFAVMLQFGQRSIYTSLILLFASILELVDVIPKIVRLLKHGK